MTTRRGKRLHRPLRLTRCVALHTATTLIFDGLHDIERAGWTCFFTDALGRTVIIEIGVRPRLHIMQITYGAPARRLLRRLDQVRNQFKGRAARLRLISMPEHFFLGAWVHERGEDELIALQNLFATPAPDESLLSALSGVGAQRLRAHRGRTRTRRKATAVTQK